MNLVNSRRRSRWAAVGLCSLAFAACTPAATTTTSTAPVAATVPAAATTAPAASQDPRVGLAPGLFDAEESIWNLRLVSTTPPPREFLGVTNSDLAFTGNYVIQGNYNGFQIWDASNPARPTLVKGYVCPASQSDVSVYRNLLFVSGEGLSGRLDCGTQGVSEAISPDRLRGIRIFDISDIRNPKYIANVQTCRGSHTHSVLVDPDDDENVYVYVSGHAGVRPEAELPGCIAALPSEDPNSALFRIEVIKVPLANPEAAAIVSQPRIFDQLVEPPRHGLTPAERQEIERQRAQGAFVITRGGQPWVLPNRMVQSALEELVRARGGTGAPTAADSAALRARLPEIEARMNPNRGANAGEPRPGPSQCHDITLYPEIGLAGGACAGYGLLLDISDPTNPVRLDAVADSNFSYWHSATFNNEGTKVLFTDEWGGGSQPKCRATDPKEWGADAIFTLQNRKMEFQSYYKLPAPQTTLENCVAHNGSLIPIPGRDVMAQAWYQGGISIFDWTDAENPVEIAFHDRGPVDPNRMGSAGSWSVYWYNGYLYSSEMARGLDVFQLVPSEYLTQNEIDASNTVRLEYLNAQGQPKYVWPASFPLARAYLDQLERSNGLPASRISALRRELGTAEILSANARQQPLTEIALQLDGAAASSSDAEKVRKLAAVVRELAVATR